MCPFGFLHQINKWSKINDLFPSKIFVPYICLMPNFEDLRKYPSVVYLYLLTVYSTILLVPQIIYRQIIRLTNNVRERMWKETGVA